MELVFNLDYIKDVEFSLINSWVIDSEYDHVAVFQISNNGVNFGLSYSTLVDCVYTKFQHELGLTLGKDFILKENDTENDCNMAIIQDIFVVIFKDAERFTLAKLRYHD